MESFGEKLRLSKCQFYSTFTFSVVAMCSFSALLFLVPFIVDPALATIMSDFSSAPVDCEVVRSGYVLGASNCSWSSCREGCTRDIFDCHQVIIEYSPLQRDKHMEKSQKKNIRPSSSSKLRAALFINIKGCGYPPSVQCSSWISEYGGNDSTVPWYYSKSNSSLAITHLDKTNNWRELLLSILIHIFLLIVSGIGLFILHTDFCGFGRNSAKLFSKV